MITPSILLSVGRPLFSDDACHWMHFDGKSSWSAPANLAGGGSVLGPSLAVFNREIFAMWQGVPGDDQIYWARFNGSWGPQKKINGVGTSGVPSMAVLGSQNKQLVALWKGVQNDHNIFFMMFDGNDDWSYNGKPQEPPTVLERKLMVPVLRELTWVMELPLGRVTPGDDGIGGRASSGK